MMYVAIILVFALLTVIYQNARVLKVNTREETIEFYSGCLSSMTLNELKTELDNYRLIRKYKPQYVFMGDTDLFMAMLKTEVNLRLPSHNHNDGASEAIEMKPSNHTVVAEF